MPESRVTSNHLGRDAYLYIRQSTLRQVSENGESTRRQYALHERALALGWSGERIHVIDQDLGMSGAHSAGRDERSASCSGSRCRAWRATPSTGSSCCSCVPTPTR